MASDSGEKTHDATPLRQEEFRKQGRFARARDASALAACAAAIGALVGTKEAAGRAMMLLFQRTHGDVTAFTTGNAEPAFLAATGALTAIALPVAVAAVLGGLALGFAQAGLRFDTDLLEIKFDRLDPLPRLQQLFNPKHAGFETLFALLRVGLVAYVAYGAFKESAPTFRELGAVAPAVALTRTGQTALSLTLKIGGALVLLSVLDYAQNRFSLNKEMKMSLTELKEESKQQEGDPKIKGKMRARARAAARRRMMSDVKKADVVVTNPTHVSVALRYSATDPAPIVVAKGVDQVALAIRVEARKHGIPIVESRSLARTLEAEVPIGKPIAGAHFGAVAQVLAYIYRLKNRKTRR